jgi:signal transduction histidine kinase
VCAAVRLHYTPDSLSIQVDDDGDGAVTVAHTRSPGPGLGLVGMRERVAALGGRLQAGPQDRGGFAVRAELPVRTPS